jgi:hypothetical protein
MTLTVGEEVSVRAITEPYIAYVDMEWISSDTEVFNAIPVGATGSEARLEALSSGTAMLTVMSGNAIRACLIIVQEAEIPWRQDSTLGEFYSNINNTNVEVRLIVSWIDGPQTGRQSIYWRERNSNIWYIQRVSGIIDEISPEFAFINSELTISWPEMNYSRTHHIFEDGTGYFSRDYRRENSVYENLRWEIIIG